MRGLSRLLLLVIAVCLLVGAGEATAFAAPVPVEENVVGPTQFPQGPQCVCHGVLLRDWQESMHSQALTDPIFRAKLAETEAAAGKKLGKFCRRCHAPVAYMTGQDGKDTLTPAAGQGVVCSFCHQVTSLTKPLANVPHLLEPTGVLRAQLKDAQAPHFTQYSALHESSRLCGGCHNVNHPGNGLKLETTYDEWEASPQAAKGIQCQDCHMSEAPPIVGPTTGFAAENAPQRSNIYRMTFAGAQVALGNAARATALLKSAAKIELVVPEIVGTAKADAKVTITNVGAGHYLPTGLTDERQMWLSVVLVDSDGVETEIGRRQFGTEFKDAKGQHPVGVPEATGIAKDDRIPPMKSVSETYAFTLSKGVESGEVVARLLYKSVPDELARKANVENPTTVMTEAAIRVYATPEAKAVGVQQPRNEGDAPAAQKSPLGPALCGGSLLFVAVLGGVMFIRSRLRGGGDDEPRDDQG
ncbi:MAG: hypothetical protein HGB10_01620 [Coriobacteriia bacterium]|nr:hypothetical protein [Coriobacteriia bacterium]